MGKIPLQISNNGSNKLTGKLEQKMKYLFQGFEFICIYIDEILLLT